MSQSWWLFLLFCCALQTTYKKCNYFHYINNADKHTHTHTHRHTAKDKGDNCTGEKNMVLAFPIRKTRVRGLCLFLTLTSLINVNDFDCWHIKRRPSLIIINTKRTWDLCTPICRVNESRWPETNTECRGGPAAQGVGGDPHKLRLSRH